MFGLIHVGRGRGAIVARHAHASARHLLGFVNCRAVTWAYVCSLSNFLIFLIANMKTFDLLKSFTNTGAS